MSASKRPRRIKGESGEHQAVKEYRAKLASIAEHTLPSVVELNAQLQAVLEIEKQKSEPPTDELEGPPTPRKPWPPPIPREDPDK